MKVARNYDFVTFIEEILDENFIFLSSVMFSVIFEQIFADMSKNIEKISEVSENSYS